ncbi:MAG: AAA family ATPase [Eubacteriaceae bacterium]|nr:AAA family ATPase [Eubacteriaceae bacterium]
MLYRKIQNRLEEYFRADPNKIMIIDGARQIGKTYIVRHVGKKMFKNYIEINLLEDSVGRRLFENTKAIEDFYLQVSMIAGAYMKDKHDTLIFLDEIQAYPHLLTMLKFLKQDDKYTYIASGSLLGVTLSKTTSIPMGSIQVVRMYPLDFEEFLYANGFNETAVTALRSKYSNKESLDERTHARVLNLFKKYLLAGGLPDAVVSYIETQNIVQVREIQSEIHEYYAMDAGKYDTDNRLKIRRIVSVKPQAPRLRPSRSFFIGASYPALVAPEYICFYQQRCYAA